ncbi:MAG: low-specificity L-threonine aldolase [Candidatus Latescibacterota bacterium]|jgi:threonine aldolase
MGDRTIDLRSDTVTRPTEAMRQAMVRAEVGDDVYGEDPTVNRLQEMAAERMGMEAALFVPSGTMGNTIALLVHTRPGEELLVEERSHVYYWECGNYATVAGLAVRPIGGEHGVLTPERLEAALRGPNLHFPRPALVCVENTHNNASGSAWTPAQMAALSRVVREHGLALHLDGARIFNAAVALGVDPREYTRHVDSVMFCVSKGLSAPVGSLLCGTRAFVDRAVRMRKRLGGAMRQAGILAAAGIVALEQMVERLAEDHGNARLLAAGLAAIPGIAVAQPPVPTNILVVDVAGLGWTAETLVGRWRSQGVLSNPRPPSAARLVTHRHVSAADAEYVVAITRELVSAG